MISKYVTLEKYDVNSGQLFLRTEFEAKNGFTFHKRDSIATRWLNTVTRDTTVVSNLLCSADPDFNKMIFMVHNSFTFITSVDP